MSKTAIKSITAREVYSRRGHPGIEATVTTENGAAGVAVCTAGLSVGTFEVPFLYDGEKRFRGKGLRRAAQLVEEIVAPALAGLDAAKQLAIDQALIELNSSGAKLPVGGNTIAAVSAAVLKAGAASLGIPLYHHIGGTSATRLPVPGALAFLGSVRYGGGERAFGKPSYSFMAYDFPTFAEASYALWEVMTAWLDTLLKKFGTYRQITDLVVIDPGMVESDEDIWALATEVIVNCGYENRVGLQVDVAADTFYNRDKGIYEGIFSAGPKDRDDMIGLLKYMVEKYPFVIVEDPLHEQDYEGIARLTGEVDIQIVGDDFFTTSAERVRKGIEAGAANAVLLKVNQVGTITQAAEMIRLAFDNDYGVMPCESRGEGIAICDYCVGFSTGTVRECGLLDQGNRFLAIEKELGPRARFAGKEGIKGRRFSIKNSNRRSCSQ
jgi:enolase